MTRPSTSQDPVNAPRSRPLQPWLALDLVAVLGFVAVGRAEHDDDGSSASIVEIAAPFLIALAVGWLAMRAWRAPLGALTGAGVWVITVIVGLLGRRFVFEGGAALAFVIVTALFLGLTINGWRPVVRGAIRHDGERT